MTFVSASSTQGSCTGTVTVTCSIGNMASGANVTVTIRITPSSAGSLSNAVAVTTVSVDSNSGNNSVTEATTVQPR